MNTFTRSYIIVFSLLAAFGSKGQSPGALTIEDCYALAKQNYPLLKQRELISKTREYSLDNASKGYLPQVSVNGQATYQSDVTKIPVKLPGMDIPELSKDQYKLYGEINQAIFDGGAITQQKQLHEVNAIVEQQKVEVELYKLKERINQFFFGVLLVDEQLKQVDLLKKDIQSGISKTEASIVNGTALKSTRDVLRAEILKADQHSTELQATRKAYIDMLALFLNRPLDQNTKLVKPQELAVVPGIHRPEMVLFDYRKRLFDVQNKMITARNLPKFNLFLQGGYGRPALDMLNNQLKPYYIGGIRMNWSLNGLYTNRKDRALLDISRKSVDVEKETFLFNTNLVLKQEDAQIGKLKQLLSLDDEIIALRTNIKNAALAQLQNGMINSNDYLRELNAEDQARLNRILHEIQLQMAQFNQQVTTGNLKP